jgi:3-hydroxyisobutyrate dehydrogenase-like beta-hydroxyacid dehydrogenase
MRVGIVGTGEMGRPLTDRVHNAGFDVTAFARRPEARAHLENHGVQCVDEVVSLARGRDVVIIYVYSDDQLRSVALDAGLVSSMERGSTLVVHTTASPRTIEAIAAEAASRDIGVVDAPGSGGPSQVADGTLTLFVGGAGEVVERCAPLFATYATKVVHFGPSGSGQKVKLVNNLLFGAQVELAVEAAELCDLLGVAPALVAQTLHDCSGASYALDLLATMGSVESLVTAVGRFVHKDVLTARAAADDAGSRLAALGTASAALLRRTGTDQPGSA